MTFPIISYFSLLHLNSDVISDSVLNGFEQSKLLLYFFKKNYLASVSIYFAFHFASSFLPYSIYSNNSFEVSSSTSFKWAYVRLYLEIGGKIIWSFKGDSNIGSIIFVNFISWCKVGSILIYDFFRVCSNLMFWIKGMFTLSIPWPKPINEIPFEPNLSWCSTSLHYIIITKTGIQRPTS